MDEIPFGSIWSNRTADGKHFKNFGDAPAPSIGFGPIVAWQWRRYREADKRIPSGGYKAFGTAWLHQCDVRASLQKLRADPATARLDHTFWIGHATILLCLASGVNILFDPIFSQRASPVAFLGPKRLYAPATTIDTLPPITAVAVSHNHYDHLDKASITSLATQFPTARFIVPLKLDRYLTCWGVQHDRVTALDWWQSIDVAQGVMMRCLPAQHWSLRTLFDRNETLWCGWSVEWGGSVPVEPSLQACTDAALAARETSVKSTASIETPALVTSFRCEGESLVRRFYFAGDTAFNADMFREIHRRVDGFDMAAIPIGAFKPRPLMSPQHIDPEHAVEAMTLLHVRRAIGMHFGTFELADDAVDEPPRVLAEAMRSAALPLDRFCAVPMGEPVSF